EKGGTTARMVFIGFGIALVHKFFTQALKLWAASPQQWLYSVGPDGVKKGFKGAQIEGDLSPELLGVGYLIGPRIAGLMMAGAVLSYWVLGPMIATFGDKLKDPVSPATVLISSMDPDKIKAGIAIMIKTRPMLPNSTTFIGKSCSVRMAAGFISPFL